MVDRLVRRAGECGMNGAGQRTLDVIHMYMSCIRLINVIERVVIAADTPLWSFACTGFMAANLKLISRLIITVARWTPRSRWHTVLRGGFRFSFRDRRRLPLLLHHRFCVSFSLRSSFRPPRAHVLAQYSSGQNYTTRLLFSRFVRSARSGLRRIV